MTNPIWANDGASLTSDEAKQFQQLLMLTQSHPWESYEWHDPRWGLRESYFVMEDGDVIAYLRKGALNVTQSYYRQKWTYK